MHYLYQGDERALPGNLQNRRYSFLPPPPKCSVCHYLPTFPLSPALSLTPSRRLVLPRISCYSEIHMKPITAFCGQN
jgi:hypothetical protein